MKYNSNSTSRRTAQGNVVLALLFAASSSTQASAQVLEHHLTAFDASTQDYFGESTAIIPGWAFAATKYDFAVVPWSGAVHVFRQSGSGWGFSQKLKSVPPVGLTTFGNAIAASGDWLAVAAFNESVQGVPGKGAVHVFQRQGDDWVYQQKLFASDYASAATTSFGSTVDIHGPTIVVGTVEDHTLQYLAGTAYVFELQGGTWAQTSKLYASDFEYGAFFGYDVAVHGDTIVASATDEDNGVMDSNQGAVYVFERAGGSWTQVQKLTHHDSGQFDRLGFALDVEGDTIFASSVFHKHNGVQQSAVYVFTKQGGSWVETQELFAADDMYGMGRGISVSGDLAVFGHVADSKAAPGAGAVHVFRRAGPIWSQIGKFVAPDGGPVDYLGLSVAIEGATVVVGASRDDVACPSQFANCDSGSAYLFRIAPQAEQYCSCPGIGPCGNHDAFVGGCLNSSAKGAVLSAGGSSSVLLDELVIESRWLPTDRVGILFMGSDFGPPIPFGDGMLCIRAGTTGFQRFLPPKNSGTSGSMTWGPGLIASTQSNPPLTQISAGQTWHFQNWFRDPSGPCGSTYNLSNALKIQFLP